MSYQDDDGAAGDAGRQPGPNQGHFFDKAAISPVVAALKVESGRAQRFVEDALVEMKAEAGDLRLFALALLDQAVALHVSIEGDEALLRTVARLARERGAGGASLT